MILQRDSNDPLLTGKLLNQVPASIQNSTKSIALLSIRLIRPTKSTKKHGESQTWNDFFSNYNWLYIYIYMNEDSTGLVQAPLYCRSRRYAEYPRTILTLIRHCFYPSNGLLMTAHNRLRLHLKFNISRQLLTTKSCFSTTFYQDTQKLTIWFPCKWLSSSESKKTNTQKWT